MCGIVGYIGERQATPILLDGLRRLEYRGYDSAGIAVVNGSGLEVRRSVGRIERLQGLVDQDPVSGTLGLGHTRWATHGRPSDANAHPHADCTGRLVVVHNGIVENYLPLRLELEAQGHRFRSETDTEVMAHLVERHIRRGHDLAAAVRRALQEIRGAYAFCLLHAQEPDRIVAAKRGAGSVVIGLADGEVFVASDIPAVLPYTRAVTILEDDEVALITRQRIAIATRDNREIERRVSRIHWDAGMAEKGGYRHFMLKEIHEQPQAVNATFSGRISPRTGTIDIPEAHITPRVATQIQRVLLVACGTSYHAALIGRCMIERLAGLPAEVDVASEFRYRDPLIGPETLVVAISQSGETADTLGAAKITRERSSFLLGITNVVGSALAREASGVVYTHAGPEIGVASSKTFTATLTACYLLGLTLGLHRGHLTPRDAQKRLAELVDMPLLMDKALAGQNALEAIAHRLAERQSFLYLGRGVHHAVALEGALKLKEISYAHAEGYPAGEMKHGPIALIDERMPVVVLAPRDPSYDRMLGNIEEVKARGGQVVAVCNERAPEVERLADHLISVPAAPDLLAPMVSVIPLQMLAYHIALLRGCDVDKPRNLAKSVTVE